MFRTFWSFNNGLGPLSSYPLQKTSIQSSSCNSSLLPSSVANSRSEVAPCRGEAQELGRTPEALEAQQKYLLPRTCLSTRYAILQTYFCFFFVHWITSCTIILSAVFTVMVNNGLFLIYSDITIT